MSHDFCKGLRALGGKTQNFVHIFLWLFSLVPWSRGTMAHGTMGPRARPSLHTGTICLLLLAPCYCSQPTALVGSGSPRQHSQSMVAAAEADKPSASRAAVAHAGTPHSSCAVRLVEQESRRPCVLNQSFGCRAHRGNNPVVWVRGCRGSFMCSGEDGDSPVTCGYPPGKAFYECKCPSCAEHVWAQWDARPRYGFVGGNSSGHLHILSIAARGRRSAPAGSVFGAAADRPRAIPT